MVIWALPKGVKINQQLSITWHNKAHQIFLFIFLLVNSLAISEGLKTFIVHVSIYHKPHHHWFSSIHRFFLSTLSQYLIFLWSCCPPYIRAGWPAQPRSGSGLWHWVQWLHRFPVCHSLWPLQNLTIHERYFFSEHSFAIWIMHHSQLFSWVRQLWGMQMLCIRKNIVWHMTSVLDRREWRILNQHWVVSWNSQREESNCTALAILLCWCLAVQQIRDAWLKCYISYKT